MAKKLVRGTGLRLTLSDLHKAEDRLHVASSKIYDLVLHIQDVQTVTNMEFDAKLCEFEKVLLKQIKDEALEIVKGYRALTHFSWEKLAETEERIIQAQNAATKITMLVSMVQCVLTLVVVGAMLWFR